MSHPEQTDVLKTVLSIAQGGPWARDEVRVVEGEYGKRGEPLAVLWHESKWPGGMYRVLEWSLSSRAESRAVLREAFGAYLSRDDGAPEDRALVEAAYDELLTDEDGSTDAAFWKMTPKGQHQLADALREVAPPLRTFKEFCEEAFRREAERAERRKKRRRVGFGEFFRRQTGVGPPFSLPTDLVTIQEMDLGPDEVGDALVGTPSAKKMPLLVQSAVSAIEALPDGYFMTGFWGHGLNAHSFYFCAVNQVRRVYLRFGFAGVGDELLQNQRRVIVSMERLAAFEEEAASLGVARWTLASSMSEGFVAIKRADGSRHRESLYHLDWSSLSAKLRGE